MNGRFVVALALGGKARVMVAVVPEQADEIRRRHKLGRAATVLAAEGLVASVLMSAHIKGEERMTVTVGSEYPTFNFTADIDATGVLRARFTPQEVNVPVKKFSGVLFAMKSLGQRDIYRGAASVVDESFDGALQRYLTDSQQVDARVRILARLTLQGEVRFASGMLIERLPGLSAETFAEYVDAAIRGTEFERLMESFAFGQLAGEPIEVLGTQDFVFQCSCSQDRVAGMLRALGLEEVQSLIDEGHAEVNCNYCNTEYRFDRAALVSLAEGLPPAS